MRPAPLPQFNCQSQIVFVPRTSAPLLVTVNVTMAVLGMTSIYAFWETIVQIVALEHELEDVGARECHQHYRCRRRHRRHGINMMAGSDLHSPHSWMVYIRNAKRPLDKSAACRGARTRTSRARAHGWSELLTGRVSLWPGYCVMRLVDVLKYATAHRLQFCQCG